MSSVVDHAIVSRSMPRRPRVSEAVAGIGGWVVVAVGVALVAIAAAVDSAGARPFTSLRWALVSTAVCAGALGVARWALPRWHAVAWTGLVGCMAVGAMAGPDPTTAWLGHPQRHLGVFTWAVFALAAAVGAHLATPPSVSAKSTANRALPSLEIGVVIVAGNIALTSIVDALGWDPAGSSFAQGRIGGVFGQPVVLASVAVLVLPMVVACRRVGLVRWVVAAGLLITVGLTQTRGAVLGLVAVAVVSAPTWGPTLAAWARRAHGGAVARRGRTVVAALVALAAVGALAVSLAVSPFGERLGDFASSSRVDEWALGLDVLVDNPLAGVGPEGYRIAVLEHLDADYVAAYGRDVVIDRAHSAPLDVAVSGGAFAGVIYVALIASVVVATWRRQRDATTEGRDRVAVAAGLGAVGVFAAGLVAFPVAAVGAVTWLFAGIALAAPLRKPRRPWARRIRVVSCLAVGALAVAAWAGATDVLADHDMGDATAAAASGRTAAAVHSAEGALDLRGDLVDAHWLAATVAATGPTILDLDRAISFAETGLERFPRDPALRDLRTDLLVERALRSGLATDIEAAVAALDDLADSDPTSLVVESGTDRLTEACLIRCDKQP